MAIKVAVGGEPNPIEAGGAGQEQGGTKKEQIPKIATRNHLCLENRQLKVLFVLYPSWVFLPPVPNRDTRLEGCVFLMENVRKDNDSKDLSETNS